MVRDFNYFPHRGIYVDEGTDHLSAHLFFLGGTKWKSLRQQLTPTFTSGKMRAMFGIVRDCARIMVDVVPSGRDVEVRELIARYSTDVIASSAFGIDVDSQHNPEAEFRQWGRCFFKTSLRSYLTLSLGFSNPKLRTLLPLPSYRRISQSVGVLPRWVRDLFHHRKLLAYELSRHLDIQKKLQEEVDDIMKKTKGDVTYEDIMTKMPYMEKVVLVYVPLLDSMILRLELESPGADDH
ncbi:probable cytochrome P450 6a17 [Schistocerca gregaria]|uniref:probable cytochrome P450 6a17 n=1 Tax=Schistocerca gregaria TaxID=7010 RepID=UPI00211E5A3C|nr:probable cytochrome P450 6a17 [Schistocerca gregaria]